MNNNVLLWLGFWCTNYTNFLLTIILHFTDNMLQCTSVQLQDIHYTPVVHSLVCTTAGYTLYTSCTQSSLYNCRIYIIHQLYSLVCTTAGYTLYTSCTQSSLYNCRIYIIHQLYSLVCTTAGYTLYTSCTQSSLYNCRIYIIHQLYTV